MRHRRWIVPVVLTLVALAPGCVTKKLFRENAETVGTRVQAVETGVEANERRIGDLRQETDSKLAKIESKTERAVEVGSSALNRADQAMTAAEKAARGKLLWTVTLSDDGVKFGFGEARVPTDSAATLNQLISQIKSEDRAVYVEIEGHTDNTGGDEYNRALGLRRADAVRNYLNEGGIPLHAMSTISFGEARPVADNSTPTGRAQNRRVVIRVLE